VTCIFPGVTRQRCPQLRALTLDYVDEARDIPVLRRRYSRILPTHGARRLEHFESERLHIFVSLVGHLRMRHERRLN